MEQKILAFWYGKNWLAYLLLPFAWLFQFLCHLRRWRYLNSTRIQFDVPVIIVGNISLGGTGKTPLVVWLANFLLGQGFRPGVVTRGYGGTLKKSEMVCANPESDVRMIGDEALLLARNCRAPVMVGVNRPAAVKALLDRFPDINIIICDDGLQHYALKRDIEIVVMDGQRRIGNGFCLPAGPLRESVRRLNSVDFVVTNGPALENEWGMSVSLSSVVAQVNNPQKTQHLADFTGQTVHAIAGIGHPEKFFTMLQEKGISIIKHYFEDHHRFKAQDLQFQDNLPLLMTQKDAVKCCGFAPNHAWFVPLEVNLSQEFSQLLLQRITNGQKIVRHSGLPDL